MRTQNLAFVHTVYVHFKDDIYREFYTWSPWSFKWRSEEGPEYFYLKSNMLACNTRSNTINIVPFNMNV